MSTNVESSGIPCSISVLATPGVWRGSVGRDDRMSRAVLLTALVCFALAGCNTMEGIGRDVKKVKAGDHVSGSEDAKV